MAEAERGIVAIVDDDHAVRELVQFLLEISGHTVETFTSAAEFLKANLLRFVCLILDHLMPRMTGLELADRLRAYGSTIPILLITGSPSPIIFARAAELGIYKVLEKPFDEDELLDFVNTHRP